MNANVLLYLKEGDSLRLRLFERRDRRVASPSVYYLGQPAQYYMYGRAYSHGIRCLGASAKQIVDGLLAAQKSRRLVRLSRRHGSRVEHAAGFRLPGQFAG